MLRTIVRATTGLVDFRRGRLEKGRAEYEMAIESAVELSPRLETIAIVHLAAEEIRAATPDAGAALERATKRTVNGG
jgi:hypothetical protein